MNAECDENDAILYVFEKFVRMNNGRLIPEGSFHVKWHDRMKAFCVTVRDARTQQFLHSEYVFPCQLTRHLTTIPKGMC